jgi:hypothetical protein
MHIIYFAGAERERNHVTWPERASREFCIVRETVQLTPKAEAAREIARNFPSVTDL